MRFFILFFVCLTVWSGSALAQGQKCEQLLAPDDSASVQTPIGKMLVYKMPGKGGRNYCLGLREGNDLRMLRYHEAACFPLQLTEISSRIGEPRRLPRFTIDNSGLDGQVWFFGIDGRTDMKAKVACIVAPKPTVPPGPVMLRGRYLFDMPEYIGHDNEDCGKAVKLQHHASYKIHETKTDSSYVKADTANLINGTAHCLCKDLTGVASGKALAHFGFWSKQLGFIWFQEGGATVSALQRLEASGRHVIGVRAEVGSEFTVDKVICPLPRN